MNPYNLWLPLLAIFGIAVVGPAWMHFTGPALSDLPIHVRFLASLVLPMFVLLLGVSWLEPGGA